MGWCFYSFHRNGDLSEGLNLGVKTQKQSDKGTKIKLIHPFSQIVKERLIVSQQNIFISKTTLEKNNKKCVIINNFL